MHSQFTSKLLGLDSVIITKVVRGNDNLQFFITTDPSPQICPSCAAVTSRIHDYRLQKVKDISIHNKDVYLVLKKRRYVCTNCGKRFYETYPFLPRYLLRTTRTTKSIAYMLYSNISMKDIARENNVSPDLVGKILDQIQFPVPDRLPEVLSIDEFKGNAGGSKFQVILVDQKKHRVIDILPDRIETHLAMYFRQFPPSQRKRVRFFVMDMYQPYQRIAGQFFPDAKIIIDRYHYVRQVIWALENVRKRVQKTMSVSRRKYYKRSKSILLKRYETLDKEKKVQCDLMLAYSEDLRTAHRLKEKFLEICDNPKYSEQRKDYWIWIQDAEESRLPEFDACITAYKNWSREILNSFKHKEVSNGVTEGFNNKVKVLKRTTYGIRDPERLRTRILLQMN